MAATLKRTVLVADDDEEILRVVSLALSKKGYRVVAAKDGQEALAKTRQEKPDAILLDIMMPGLDGFGVLQELRRDESVSSIPVGFLTGREDREAYERARELGGHFYLMKPFSTAKLVAFVGLLLGEKDA